MGVIPDPDETVSKLDALAPPAAEPANTVLPDEAHVVRWAGRLFVLCSVVMLPWTVYLAESLPRRQLSANYDIAWTGFDVILMVVLASTAYFALRRSPYLTVTAASAATLLAVDAWFDCLTTPAHQLWQSILLAVLIELPLATVCAWLSYHTEQLSQQRIVLLLRRRNRVR